MSRPLVALAVALLTTACGLFGPPKADLAGSETVSVQATYAAPLSEQDVAVLQARMARAQPSPTLSVDDATVTLAATGVRAMRATQWMDHATRPGMLTIHPVQRDDRKARAPVPGGIVGGQLGLGMDLDDVGPDIEAPLSADPGLPTNNWADPPRIERGGSLDSLAAPHQGLTWFKDCSDPEPQRCRAYQLHPPAIQGDLVASSRFVYRDYGRQLRITMEPPAKDAFARFTEASVGQQMGVVLDGELLSTPVIAEPIPGGMMTISARREDYVEERIHDTPLGSTRTGFQVLTQR